MKKGIRGMNVCLTLVITLVLITAPLTLPGEQPVSASVDQGVIAYVAPNDQTGDEIHLINPDGTGDKMIWRTGKPGVELMREVHSLAWKPNASELAFVSSFDELCSLYHEDVYAINLDGTGLRRQTAPPRCANPGLPTGTVVLTIDSAGSDGVILVYVQGAPKAQSTTLSPGAPTVLTFNNVMDFGDGVLQWAVGIWGVNRYLDILSHVDVLPGKTVHATLTLSNRLPLSWASPTYSGDGKYMAYIDKPNIAYYAPSHNTNPGGIGSYWQPDGSKMTYSPSHMQWIGDTPEGSVLLFLGSNFDNYGFYLADHQGSTLLAEVVDEPVFGMAKLPDASGLIYSSVLTRSDEECIFQQYGEIFEYDFNSGETTQLSHFGPRPSLGNYNCPDGPFPYEVTISPDGSKIAFEMQFEGSWRDPVYYLDLWEMNRDGSGAKQLVKGGLSPSWSPGAVVLPPKMKHFYLPLVRR